MCYGVLPFLTSSLCAVTGVSEEGFSEDTSWLCGSTRDARGRRRVPVLLEQGARPAGPA